MNMLVDIGNGTMSILEIHDGRPIEHSIRSVRGTSVYGKDTKGSIKAQWSGCVGDVD